MKLRLRTTSITRHRRRGLAANAMRSQSTEHAVVFLLRQCYVSSRCQAPPSWRSNQWSRTPLQLQRGIYPRLHQRRAYHSKRNDGSINSVNFLSHTETSNDPTTFRSSTANLSQSGAQQVDGGGGAYAVLGGGITGLSTAHYLTKHMPHANITIYESNNRLGGWLSSERVAVDGGDVLFEQGPRSLRPNAQGSGLAVMELV
jgi:oxygen-dependent protoporphyrinogen oxidase